MPLNLFETKGISIETLVKAYLAYKYLINNPTSLLPELLSLIYNIYFLKFNYL